MQSQTPRANSVKILSNQRLRSKTGSHTRRHSQKKNDGLSDRETDQMIWHRRESQRSG